MDGWDERCERTSNEILAEALANCKEGKHKLLLTCRPQGLSDAYLALGILDEGEPLRDPQPLEVTMKPLTK